MGLAGEKAVATTGLSGTDVDDLPDDTPLEGLDITTCRGVAARCNYLGPDCPDAVFAIKERCREISAPTTESIGRLKRVGRYVRKSPRLVWTFDLQEAVDHIESFSWTTIGPVAAAIAGPHPAGSQWSEDFA